MKNVQSKKGVALLYTIITMMLILAMITVVLALSTINVATTTKYETAFERRVDLDNIAEQFLEGDITSNTTIGIYDCRVNPAQKKLVVKKGNKTLLTVIYTGDGDSKTVTTWVYGEN